MRYKVRSKDRKLALDLMKILALAGADQLSDLRFRRKLLTSNFFNSLQSEIETDPSFIKQNLTERYATDSTLRSTKFYALPFKNTGYYTFLFFRPYFFESWDGCKIEVVQLGAARDLPEVAYRVERGHAGGADNPHAYLHVQMVDKIGAIDVALPKGFSPKYPAFPIGDRQPFSPFYATLLAFAGMSENFEKGFFKRLEDFRDFAGDCDFEELTRRLKITMYSTYLQQQKSPAARMLSRLESKLAALKL